LYWPAEAAAVVGPALVGVGASASLAADAIATIAVAAVSEIPTRYPEPLRQPYFVDSRPADT